MFTDLFVCLLEEENAPRRSPVLLLMLPGRRREAGSLCSFMYIKFRIWRNVSNDRKET